MPNRSTFPPSIDLFTEHVDLSPSDVLNANRWQELKLKSNKTADEIIEYNTLTTQLSTKIFSPEDLNKLQDCITALETFFQNNVEGYITQKQSEMQSEIDKFSDKGVFNISSQYYKNNFVSFNDGTGMKTYICTQNCINIEPTNILYWRKLTIEGQKGAAGVGLNFKGAWDSITTFVINDAVQFGNMVFGALQASTNQQPNITSDTAYWAKALSPQVTTTKLSGIRSITSSASNINFITGQISVFNPSVDSIEVFVNSTRLTQGYDYTINADNQSIDKTSGSWDGTVGQPVFFEFVVLRNACNNLVFSDGQSIAENTVSLSKLMQDAKPYFSVSPPDNPKIGQVWIDIS